MAARSQRSPGETLTLLVVDDEYHVCRFIADYLRSTYQYLVDTVSSGPAALDLLASRKYDAVISDYEMAGMSGIDLLRGLRGKGDKTPFIIFTGRGREEVVIEAFESGADGYVQKGDDIQAQFTELVQKINNAVATRNAEDALSQSENFLSSIIENIPDVVFVKSVPDFRYIRFNRAGEDFLGLHREKILGKTNYDLFSREEADHFAISDQEAIESRSVVNIPEEPIWIRDKGKRILHTKKVPLYDESGTPVFLLGISEDITDRIRVTEDRDRLKIHLEYLLGVTGTGIDIVDPDHNLVYVDPAWQKTYGDYHGKKCYDYFMDADRPCRLCGVRDALASKKPVINDEVLAREGDRIVEVHTIPYQEKDGSWLIAEFNLDVTDRKQYEEQITGYARDLELLSHRSIEMLDLESDDQIYILIGSIIKDLVPEGTIVVTSQVNTGGGSVTPRSVIGLESSHHEIIEGYLDGLLQSSYPLTDELIRQMITGKLYLVPDGFRGLTLDVLSDELYQKIESSGCVGSIYEVGLAWKHETRGSVSIILPPDTELKNPSLIEIFIQLAALELQRRETAAALQEERGLFIGGPVVVFRWKVSDEWPVQYVTPNCSSQFGYLPEEFSDGSISFADIVHPDDWDRIRSDVHKFADTGINSFEQEFRLRRRDGEYRWVYDFTVIERDVAGSITSFQGYILDVHERRLVEHRLRETEENARSLINAPKESIMMIDLDGTVLYANETVASRMHTTVEDMVGRSAYTFLSHDIADKRRLYAIEAVRSGRPVQFIDHRSGHAIENNIYPLKNETGQVTRIALYGRDITEKLDAERKIAESEIKYRELVQNANSIIIRFGNNGNIVFFNEFGQEFFGYSEKELIEKGLLGTILEETGIDGRDHREMMRELFRQPDKYVHNENWNVCRDGRKVWIAWRNRPIYEHGELTGLLSVGTDITDRRKMEEALSQANKKLNLLSSITRHDVLNLITALRGFQDISEELTPEGELRDYLKKEIAITSSIQTQIEFTKDYQDLGVAAPIWHDLNTIINHAAGKLPVKHIRITVDIPEIEVLADPLFEKVFYTLIENGIRHGERIDTISWSGYETGEGFSIVYEDNGIGIETQEKERIFIRGIGKHTGLGLFLIREILTITGLSIRETGIPGKGARFEIMIPKGAYRKNDERSKGSQ